MSASEVAFFSLTPADIKMLQNTDRKNDKLAIALISNPQRLLATILTGNNLVNITIVILSTFTTHRIFNFGGHHLWEFFFQTVIITFLLLLFGEIIPKIYATSSRLGVARQHATLLQVFSVLFFPISKMLIGTSGIFSERLEKSHHASISVDELSTALKLTSENEKVSDENELLKGIVNFGNISVSQVMTARLNMTSLNISTPFKQVLCLVAETGYSRIPVFSGSEDNIRGILYVKDLLPHLDKGDNFRWQSLVRNAYFVPETKMIDDLLTDFQKNKVHIAIVVDEYGGTSGVVTMKDILEEIIGHIGNEYDDEEPALYHKIGASSYIFEAKIPLNDFFRIDGISEKDFDDLSDEVETLAGLILEIKGEIPVNKEKISYKNYEFIIERADNRHIVSVRLNILQPDAASQINQ
ncbi:MAG: gliding motility-associated protein GldE [Paludibacteraceae bacterium]|nr:gliding motility-associated protein GldE [Paludibacteraceae bacterium]